MSTDHRFDTICAPATTAGSGAICVVRISGEKAMEIVDMTVEFRKGTASECKGGRVKFGSVKNADGSLLDEVLVSIFRAPHSYTGEDSAEISCHASPYIVSKIMRILVNNGCRLAEPGEFTQRAFIGGKMDLTQAEAVADVIAASTEAAHRVAINQLKGGFSSELAGLRSQLLEMASLMELELDFSEEEVEFADRTRLNALVDAVLSKINSLASSFALGNAIKNGVPVAIVGPTNAGKSTLLNAILGEQRAIVSDIEGTTRDTIEECLNVDGVLFRFIDTAGIRREGADEIERIGMERSLQSISKAQIVLLVVDATKDNSEIIAQIKNMVADGGQKLIICLNKVDLSLFEGSEGMADDGFDSFAGADIVRISAKEGMGVREMLADLAHKQKLMMSATSENSVLVTNIRHYEALTHAYDYLTAVHRGLNTGMPTDLVASDLRIAIDTLGSITGHISSQDILNNIFRNFCIGK